MEYKTAYLTQSNFREIFMILSYLFVCVNEENSYNKTGTWVVKL